MLKFKSQSSRIWPWGIALWHPKNHELAGGDPGKNRIPCLTVEEKANLLKPISTPVREATDIALKRDSPLFARQSSTAAATTTTYLTSPSNQTASEARTTPLTKMSTFLARMWIIQQRPFPDWSKRLQYSMRVSTTATRRGSQTTACCVQWILWRQGARSSWKSARALQRAITAWNLWRRLVS